MPRRKICAVSGSRADYGLVRPLLELLRDEPGFELQMVVTAMHLSPEFGLTYREIEGDGFAIDARVEMLLSSDTPVGTAKSIGLGTIGFGEAFEWLAPDLVLLTGDRFEMLAAAQAALVSRLPVAHVFGGDVTEGAFDEAIRHSITKMSHLHFVSNAESGRRVRQLGEDPARIFEVGSPGIDAIKQVPLLDRAALERDLEFALLPRNLLITFHPATLADQPANRELAALLGALEHLGNDVGLIFTMPNADPSGRKLIDMILAFVADRPNARAYASLGQHAYLSALAVVDAVVGNSSSGLYEAPSFDTPTVNIGERQKGRLRATSVIDCRPQTEAIAAAIEEALARDVSGTVNPYGDGTAARKIVERLTGVSDWTALLRKRFFDLPS